MIMWLAIEFAPYTKMNLPMLLIMIGFEWILKLCGGAIMYKKLTSLFFILSLILSFNVFAAECVLDGSPESDACVANMLSDDSNSAVIGILGLGAVGYFLLNRKIDNVDEEEKEKLLSNFRSGNGVELYKKNNFGVYYYKQNKLEHLSIDSHGEYFKELTHPTTQILSIQYKLH